MVMLVCAELGKTEQEVSSWSVDDVIRWVAFFRLKSKAEAKAIEQARQGSSRGPTRSNTQVTFE